MRLTAIVCDANVALKWFHDGGEQMLGEARAILRAHRDGRLVARVLDLTLYEVGNALLRAPARASADQTATVVNALAALCQVLAPTPAELARGAHFAEQHGRTLYDAAYAAVADARDATLVTLDGGLLAAGLGEAPASVAERLDLPLP